MCLHADSIYFTSCNLISNCEKAPEAILDFSVAVGCIAAPKIFVFVIVSAESSSTGLNIAGNVEILSRVEVAVNVVYIRTCI